MLPLWVARRAAFCPRGLIQARGGGTTGTPMMRRMRMLTRRCVSDWGGRAAAEAKAHNRKRIRKIVTRVVLGTLIGVPTYKVVHASIPLFRKDEEATTDGEEGRTRQEAIPTEVLQAEETTSKLLWLLSTASDRLIRDIVTAGLIVWDYYRAQRRGDQDWSKTHEQGAKRLLKLCQVNRGIYIKLGQHIAQLDYILPSEYVETMKKMLRECPETSWEQVCHVFEHELGASPNTLFRDIDKTPIASASLAQVHIATDFQGNKLAVKIQHEGLYEMCEVDIKTISFLVDMVRWMFPKFEYTVSSVLSKCVAPHLLELRSTFWIEILPVASEGNRA
eukprot:gb/GECG01000671.1/.p1 GENE.gb/GECG01000671.1/~~gb/GECG01000671.1/.p1  ORF type:complete len:333 (+),score=26.87 gb/GECG01000671.1/:1-999(+)